MKKVKSIIEAFSMQPNSLYVMTEEKAQSYYDKPNACKRIELETRQVESDKACDFYVGYNFNDEEIFSYLRSSVNVHYEYKTP